MSPSQLAWLDILNGARAWIIWGLLGWLDIRQRYRRSTLGPFWLTISTGAMVGGIGFLYAGLLRTEIRDYLSFLTLGFIIWGLIGGLMNENCSAFIAAEPIIKQVRMPLSIHVYRVVWRSLIVFLHNFIIFVVVAVVFALWPSWPALLALPGLFLLCLNGVWIGILFGLACARFRDVPPIVASMMQLAFFMTPIIWKPEHLGADAWVLVLNPFYHSIELVRGPLLGQVPALHSWIAVLSIACFGWAVTFFAYARYRGRIAYWL